MSALDSWLAGIASTPSPPADRADRKSSPAAPGDFDRAMQSALAPQPTKPASQYTVRAETPGDVTSWDGTPDRKESPKAANEKADKKKAGAAAGVKSSTDESMAATGTLSNPSPVLPSLPLYLPGLKAASGVCENMDVNGVAPASKSAASPVSQPASPDLANTGSNVSAPLPKRPDSAGLNPATEVSKKADASRVAQQVSEPAGRGQPQASGAARPSLRDAPAELEYILDESATKLSLPQSNQTPPASNGFMPPPNPTGTSGLKATSLSTNVAPDGVQLFPGNAGQSAGEAPVQGEPDSLGTASASSIAAAGLPVSTPAHRDWVKMDSNACGLLAKPESTGPKVSRVSDQVAATRHDSDSGNIATQGRIPQKDGAFPSPESKAGESAGEAPVKGPGGSDSNAPAAASTASSSPPAAENADRGNSTPVGVGPGHPAIHSAFQPAPAARINAGMGVAFSDSPMKNPQNTNKVAGSEVKVLPVGGGGETKEKDLPTVVPTVRAAEPHSDFNLAYAKGDAADHLADAGQALKAVELPLLTDVRMRALDRAHDMVALHAMRLAESKSEVLSVMIRPAVGMELSLELRQHADGVTAQATLLRGDHDFLNQHWPELQHRLEQRGITLGALGGDPGQSAGDERHGGAKASPEGIEQQQAFAEFAASQGGGATARLAAAYDGWESWA